MEFKVLGLTENSSRKDVADKLEKIKQVYNSEKWKHCSVPRELVALADSYVNLAQLASDTIEEKRIVDHAITSLTVPLQTFSQSYYYYKDSEGNVEESGKINGREMTKEELKNSRNYRSLRLR